MPTDRVVTISTQHLEEAKQASYPVIWISKATAAQSEEEVLWMKLAFSRDGCCIHYLRHGQVNQQAAFMR